MKIGVDVDGILACFEGGFKPLIARTSGRNLFPPGYVPHTWYYAEAMGYTKEEDKAAWDALKADPNFWYLLPAYPDTYKHLTTLRDLQFAGHEVTFITNRMGVNPKQQTEMWLSGGGFGNAPGPTVMVTPHKGLSAAALELDIYIDDKPSNCDDVLKMRGTKTKVFLLDRPWNGEFKSNYINRIYSVEEFLAEATNGAVLVGSPAV